MPLVISAASTVLNREQKKISKSKLKRKTNIAQKKNGTGE